MGFLEEFLFIRRLTYLNALSQLYSFKFESLCFPITKDGMIIVDKNYKVGYTCYNYGIEKEWGMMKRENFEESIKGRIQKIFIRS